jgi:hypothetical protein
VKSLFLLRFRAVASLVLAVGPVFPAAHAQQKPEPPAPRLEFVYEEVVTLGQDIPFGTTPWGKRNIVPITGGVFTGEKLNGKVLSGGWDWQLTTPTGCFSLHADYMIRTDDGVMIHVVNSGTVCGTGQELLTNPVIEAPEGKYGWLNGGVFVSSIEGTQLDGKRAVRIRIYRAR